MHFLAHASDLVALAAQNTPAPDPAAGGTPSAPGIAGRLEVNARLILLAALGILVLTASCAAIVSGGLRGNMKKSLSVSGAVLIGLIPAGIFLAGAVIALSTGTVGLAGF